MDKLGIVEEDGETPSSFGSVVKSLTEDLVAGIA